MGLVLGTLPDPLFEGLALGLGDRFTGLGWRHHCIGVVRDDAFEEGASLGVGGVDGTRGDRVISIIEPQVGLSGVFIGPMASEASIREDGSYIAIEVDG